MRTNSERTEVRRTLNLGLEVWLGWPLDDVGYYTVSDPSHPYYRNKACDTTFLGWCKLNDRWQLAIKRVEYIYPRPDDGDEEQEITDSEVYLPLLEAPRKTRVEAIHQFDTLISALKKAAQETLQAIRDAEKLAATE